MFESKIIVTMFLTKRNINTFDVLTLTQMHTDECKFWQTRKTSGNGCVKVRRAYDKQKFLQIAMNSMCK